MLKVVFFNVLEDIPSIRITSKISLLTRQLEDIEKVDVFVIWSLSNEVSKVLITHFVHHQSGRQAQAKFEAKTAVYKSTPSASEVAPKAGRNLMSLERQIAGRPRRNTIISCVHVLFMIEFRAITHMEAAAIKRAIQGHLSTLPTSLSLREFNS